MNKQKARPRCARQRTRGGQDGPTNSVHRSIAHPANALAETAVSQRIVSQLSKVPEIQAIFTRTDEEGVCHVYSVVEEHSSAIYQKVMKKERRIERELPDIHFSFRIRAHQGREPSLAVPLASQPLFTR
jgi:hypothetical protein